MRDGPRFRVKFVSVARRQLLSIRGSALDVVRKAIHQLADDPTPPDSIPMVGKGTGLYRLRVGVYRILYRVQDDRLIVLVVRVGHRSDVYQGFEGM